MIFTRSWLSEFIDISKIEDSDILDILNKIGLEVAGYKKLEIPKGVVVGKIVECEKHPDADKLSVCKVDNGKSVLDVVCGAKNVRKDALVALATIGAHLPGGIVIKQAALRGVQSYGMLCSSAELGLPKVNDGIMILDHSIDKIKIGEELSKLPQIADSIFEIEVTPNRGDCLSVRGVARELAAYYGLELRECDGKKTKESEKGIGRILSLHSHPKTTANAAFRVLEHSEAVAEETFLVDYRLALVGETPAKDKLKNLTSYVSHAVGVNISFFSEKAFAQTDGKMDIHLDVSENGIEQIRGKKSVLSIGIKQAPDSEPQEGDQNIIVATTYISPAVVQKVQSELKEKDDALFYRSSRGSEPDLVMGLNYASEIMSEYYGFVFYAGYAEDFKPLSREPIKVDINKINTIIGATLDKNHIVTLLRKLYFGVTVNAEFDSCAVEIPSFRHDITNVYDLSEEIVRIKGIDTIESKPLELTESIRINDAMRAYRFTKELRQKAASKGFFETVHFIFADRNLQDKFGFASLKEELEILNPITSELNTLRSTLLLNLLSSASKNAKNSQNRIALFETGVIFDENRNERNTIGFVWANDVEKDSIINAGKPKVIDMQTFVSKLADIIGDFQLTPYETKGSCFLHPYQAAHIVQNKDIVGFVAKLHKYAEEFFELKSCFVAEIELSKLSSEHKKATDFSKFQKSVRDLTLAVSSDFSYAPIEKCIASVKNPLLKSFYPIDLYKDKENSKEMSLTIRLVLQSDEKTLDENDIQSVMVEVLSALQSKLHMGLKQ
jgi:phenylalanyl-tRNA synthetase beta chain